jgi:uncharacterized repeat protein (TIGR03803 family)
MPTPSPTLTTLVTFNGVDGQDPEGTLLADAAGNLYGTTSNGGTDTDNGGFPGAAAGTVFEIVKSTNSLITLATFNGTDGALPYGSLIADAAGNLYGTTSSGGANGDGSVFEIAKGTDALTTLVSFDGTNGAHPGAGLVADAAGNLYGTTAGNGQIPEELLATGGSRINLPDITAAVGNGTVFEISGAGFVASVAPPVVAVTSPAVVTAAAVQTISGTVTDSNAVGSVSIYDNGSTTALATATVGAGGAWSTVATLPTQGSNSLIPTSPATPAAAPPLWTRSTPPRRRWLRPRASAA